MRSRARREGRAFGEGRPSLSATIEGKSRDVDHRVVKGFGEEWSRFGNCQLEVDELETMFSHESAGLENVVFSEGPPWWVAVAWRRHGGL